MLASDISRRILIVTVCGIRKHLAVARAPRRDNESGAIMSYHSSLAELASLPSNPSSICSLELFPHTAITQRPLPADLSFDLFPQRNSIKWERACIADKTAAPKCFLKPFHAPFPRRASSDFSQSTILSAH
jgi:hypothetical protein